MQNWLVAWDTILTGRLTHCLLCGRAPEVLHMGVQDLARHSVAFGLCLACRNQPAALETVARVLERRYASAYGEA